MRSVLSKCALLAALAAAPLAKADTYHFSFTSTSNPTAGNFNFDLPSSPSVSFVDPYGRYADTTETAILAGGKSFLSVTQWFRDGFSFDSGDYTLHGASPYSGTFANFSFVTGSFTMSEYDPEGSDQGLLVISNVTPEPASLWLLATGVAGVAAQMRRRRIA